MGVTIDWREFLRDHVWFGWYYRRIQWGDGQVTGRWEKTGHRSIQKRHPSTRICTWRQGSPEDFPYPGGPEW